jgi:hypothetical protein
MDTRAIPCGSFKLRELMVAVICLMDNVESILSDTLKLSQISPCFKR